MRLNELFTELSSEDKKKFCFDHSKLELEDYVENGVRQVRNLLLKEDEATLPKAREKMQKLYYADILLKGVLIGFLIWFVLKLF